MKMQTLLNMKRDIFMLWRGCMIFFLSNLMFLLQPKLTFLRTTFVLIYIAGMSKLIPISDYSFILKIKIFRDINRNLWKIYNPSTDFDSQSLAKWMIRIKELICYCPYMKGSIWFSLRVFFFQFCAFFKVMPIAYSHGIGV